MADVIAVVFAICLLIVFTFAGITFRNAMRRTTLTHRPAKTLGLHDERALTEQTQMYYKLSSRAVRQLEELVRDDMTSVVMSEKQKDNIEHIIEDFYA